MFAISPRQVCHNKIEDRKKELLEKSENTTRAGRARKLKKVCALDILKISMNNPNFNKQSLIEFRKNYPEIDEGYLRSSTSKMLNELSESAFFSQDLWPQDRTPMFPSFVCEEVSKFLSLPELNIFLQTKRQLSPLEFRNRMEKKFSEELIPYLKIPTQKMSPAQIIYEFKKFSNLKDPDLLLHAITQGKITDLKLFMRAGFDLNDWRHEGATVLHYAALCNFTHMVPFLLAQLSQTTAMAQNVYGRTVLHLAAENGCKDIIEILVVHPMWKSIVNIQDNDGSTALHLAAQNDSKETIEYLCFVGADVHARDSLGCTALYKAVEQGCIENIPPLLQYGADANAQNNLFHTILHEAVFFEGSGIHFLPMHPSFPLAGIPLEILFTLFHAKRIKYKEIVILLLPHITYDNMNTKIEGNTAYDTAIKSGRNEIATLIKDAMEILEQARKINKKNSLKKGPFYFRSSFKEDNNMTVQMAKDIINHELSLTLKTLNKITISDISELP